MLPSTGYFKAINCPFYDSGLCERPYCHFRHAKKDPNLVAGEEFENGAILQQLVSEAVKKVLQQTDPSASAAMVATTTKANTTKALPAIASAPTKLTYNPTPIAELKKINSSDGAPGAAEEDAKPRRHIPVPYTPHRPATAPVKRSADDSDASKPFIYNPPDTYSPGSGENKKPDPYLPEGATSNGKTYEPGSEAQLQTYTPPSVSTTTSVEKQNYVPSGMSDKPTSKKKIIEYEPTRASVNAGMSKYTEKSKDQRRRRQNKEINCGLTYQPTPLSKVPCFSSDEDEPDMKKKKKDEAALNGLDLESEFEMLGQILDEEETTESGKAGRSKKRTHSSSKQGEKDGSKEKHRDKEKSKEKEKSQEKKSSSKKEHKSSREKDKRALDKVKSSSSKSHKSSHKVKDEDKERDKTKHSDKIHNERSSSKESTSKSSSRSEEISKSSVKISKSSEKMSKSSEKISKSSEKVSKSSSSSKSHSKSSKDSKNEKSHRSDNHKDNKNHKKENRSSRDKERNKKSVREKSSKHDAQNGFSDLEIISDDDANVDELIELSDADEDTITMECMKIFEEYVPTSRPVLQEEAEQKSEIEEYIPTKKRVSHAIDKKIKVIEKKPIKPDYKIGAAQAMAERLAKVREFHALKNISTNTVVPENPPPPRTEIPPVITPTPPKVRIAHVPNVSTLLYAKKSITSVPHSDRSQPSTSFTTVQTIPKGSARTAHVPNDKFSDRPGVLEPLASKIPANLRSTYLNKMIDECLKIYVTPTDAYARAQQEELATSKKCTTIPIYKNSAVLAVSRLRKEFQECGGIKKTSYESENKVSHNQVLIGKLAQTSWSIEKNKKVDFTHEFQGIKFYNNIARWLLDEELLQQNGFPRPHPDGERGRAKIYSTHDKQIPPKGRLRNCCRCKKDFMADKKGFPAVKEDCNYHPNRKYRVRGEVRYQCCSQDGSSEGCAIAPSHVFDYVDLENLRGFVTTMPKDVPDPDNYDHGVYALDCEMCYTTHGLDLTRITVINSSCKTVYETLIKPLHPIVDYNTQYSGITEEHMAGVHTTLLEVQAALLSMFSNRTILVGHSLESDFKALKLIHDTVVDTSVLFPHKMGPPYKRALRNLSSEHLKKIIQNSVDGHDSAEDATVCMELIQWKLKEELKLR